MSPSPTSRVPTGPPRCPFCDVLGLGPVALLEHRWRRHTAAEYARVFGRALHERDSVRWADLRRADLERAIEQRRRTLDVVHAW